MYLHYGICYLLWLTLLIIDSCHLRLSLKYNILFPSFSGLTLGLGIQFNIKWASTIYDPCPKEVPVEMHLSSLWSCTFNPLSSSHHSAQFNRMKTEFFKDPDQALFNGSVGMWVIKWNSITGLLGCIWMLAFRMFL